MRIGVKSGCPTQGFPIITSGSTLIPAGSFIRVVSITADALKLLTSALRPGQELLDPAVISGPCVRVADRDSEKLEELFAGRRAGARDDGWKRERFLRNYGKFEVRHWPQSLR